MKFLRPLLHLQMHHLVLLLFALRAISSEVIIEDALNDGKNVTVFDCSPANTDFLVWRAPLAYFANHRASASPDCFDWSSDGCSSSPNRVFGFNFGDACQRHDFAYRNLGHQGRLTKHVREEADKNFLDDLKMVCMKVSHGKKGLCTLTRVIYFSAVRLFGNPDKACIAFAVGLIVYVLLVGLVIFWMVRRHRKRLRKVKYYGTDHSSLATPPPGPSAHFRESSSLRSSVHSSIYSMLFLRKS